MFLNKINSKCINQNKYRHSRMHRNRSHQPCDVPRTVRLPKLENMTSDILTCKRTRLPLHRSYRIEPEAFQNIRMVIEHSEKHACSKVNAQPNSKQIFKVVPGPDLSQPPMRSKLDPAVNRQPGSRRRNSQSSLNHKLIVLNLNIELFKF